MYEIETRISHSRLLERRKKGVKKGDGEFGSNRFSCDGRSTDISIDSIEIVGFGRDDVELVREKRDGKNQVFEP